MRHYTIRYTAVAYMIAINEGRWLLNNIDIIPKNIYLYLGIQA